MISNGKRVTEIDVLKGIGILFMVFAHVKWRMEINQYIKSFHMPLFFMVNGYLRKDENLSVVFHKRFKRLILPYFTYIFMFFVALAVSNFIYPGFADIKQYIFGAFVFPTDTSKMFIASPLWFLVSMFISDVLYTEISVCVPSLKKKSLIIIPIALAGCIYDYMDFPMLPFGLEPVMTAMTFMYIGECCKKHNEIFSLKTWHLILLLVLDIICIYSNGNIDMRSARYHFAPLYFLNGFLGTVFYWNISFRISSSVNPIIKGAERVLKYFGKNSITYLALNIAVITFLKLVINHYFRGMAEVNYVKLGVFVFTIGICFVCDMFLKKVKSICYGY